MSEPQEMPRSVERYAEWNEEGECDGYRGRQCRGALRCALHSLRWDLLCGGPNITMRIRSRTPSRCLLNFRPCSGFNFVELTFKCCQNWGGGCTPRRSSSCLNLETIIRPCKQESYLFQQGLSHDMRHAHHSQWLCTVSATDSVSHPNH
jgi:hypothetical protein